MKKLGKKLKKYMRYYDDSSCDIGMGDIVLYNLDIWVVYGGKSSRKIKLKSLTCQKEVTAGSWELQRLISYVHLPNNEEETLEDWITRFSKSLGHYMGVLMDEKLVHHHIQWNDDLRQQRDNIYNISDPWERNKSLVKLYQATVVKIIGKKTITELFTEKVWDPNVPLQPNYSVSLCS